MLSLVVVFILLNIWSISGIWGSSMGGGHVITIGGLDHSEGRIKCIVSQMGMMIASDLLNTQVLLNHMRLTL